MCFLVKDGPFVSFKVGKNCASCFFRIESSVKLTFVFEGCRGQRISNILVEMPNVSEGHVETKMVIFFVKTMRSLILESGIFWGVCLCAVSYSVDRQNAATVDMANMKNI